MFYVKSSLNLVLMIVLFQNPFNMKTKLLKKVRRRYSITRIDSLATNASCVLTANSAKFGFPFYVVNDHNHLCLMRSMCHKTYNQCIESLLDMIVHDYSDIVGRTKADSTKVWWK